jgi:hypothetical protein
MPEKGVLNQAVMASPAFLAAVERRPGMGKPSFQLDHD